LTREEYGKQIRKARRLTPREPRRALEILENIEQYKPTLLPWFTARAALHVRMGELEQAWKLLEINNYAKWRCHPDWADANAFAYYDVLIDSFQKAGDQDNEELFRTLRNWARHQINPADPQAAAWFAEKEAELANLERAFLQAPSDPDAVLALARQYYRCYKTVESYLFFTYYRTLRGDGAAEKTEAFLACRANFLYISNALKHPEIPFVLAEEGQTNRATLRLLRLMGHTVTLLSAYVDVAVDGPIDMQATVPISLDNAETIEEAVCAVRPIRVEMPDGTTATNTRELLCELALGQAKKNVMLLLSGEEMDAVLSGFGKNIGARLTGFESKGAEGHLALGYVGDYACMMEPVYGFNILEKFLAPPTVGISVVIPVRGFPHTLPYTIETCLQQEYQDYEVLISDNSPRENTALLDYIRELDNPKVRYVKTPGPLGLAKSFEFAYSQARGEFVFSIGADDALVPWALEHIAVALKACPEDEVIAWRRGFYVWPGFPIEHQAGQMVIVAPRCGRYDMTYYAEHSLYKAPMRAIQHMYSLPMLYINSGFRRVPFVRRLYEKTGALWEGESQDTYMGVVSALLYDAIPVLRHMIAIAGMSDGSIGQATTAGTLKMPPEYQSRTHSGFERNYPPLSGDTHDFYVMSLRAVEMGVLPAEALATLDWGKLVAENMQALDKTSPTYDRLTQELNLGVARLAAFCGRSVPTYEATDLYTMKVEEDVSYRETEDENVIIMDSRKLGITDIAKAAKYMHTRVAERWTN
jgi:hypothetical protein